MPNAAIQKETKVFLTLSLREAEVLSRMLISGFSWNPATEVGRLADSLHDALESVEVSGAHDIHLAIEDGELVQA